MLKKDPLESTVIFGVNNRVTGDGGKSGGEPGREGGQPSLRLTKTGRREVGGVGEA